MSPMHVTAVSVSVMWCLETLPRLEAASRRNFHCLGLGLSLDPSYLGLATASRHQSQRSQFFSHNVLRKLKQDLNVHKICKIYLILGHLPALH